MADHLKDLSFSSDFGGESAPNYLHPGVAPDPSKGFSFTSDKLPEFIYSTQEGINTLLLIVSTGFILLMQVGFALIENGTVRTKNSKNILIKNMFDCCIGVFTFWLVGYGFAFGHEFNGGFIGTSNFASQGFDTMPVDNYSRWIFQFSFCVTSATVVSGCLAERCQLPAYIIFSVFLTGIIYSIVVGWTWGGGWLHKLGFHDFAGCGIVHMLGGTAGFVGALIIGPRHGKEQDPKDLKKLDTETEEVKDMAQMFGCDLGHFKKYLRYEEKNMDFDYNSFPFMVFGTLILFVSWLFFNGGSTASLFMPRTNNAPKVIMNTIISGATSGLISAVFKPIVMKTFSRKNRYDVGALCNGILAGLVGITGCSDAVHPQISFVIGIFSGLIYTSAARLLKILNVDDPLEASCVHGFCGAWGLIAAGFFHNEHGLFSGSHDRGHFFGVQVLGLIAIVAWTATLSGILFSILNWADLLRVDLLEEIVGLDYAEMGSARREGWFVPESKGLDYDGAKSAGIPPLNKVASEKV